MNEYMTYIMFQEDEESNKPSTYSSSLNASVGASFFKIPKVRNPMNKTYQNISKALTDDPHMSLQFGIYD